MLEELAEGGRLDVRARGGGLFYALWGPADAARGMEEPVVGGAPPVARGS